MKELRLCLSLVLALPVFALIGSGAALAEDAEVGEPASDTIDQIVAKGDVIRLGNNFAQKSVTVSFADLNINNEPGAKVLYSRLKRASETVCDVQDARKTRCVEEMRAADECYHMALTTAVDKIDSDVLMSLHRDEEPAEMLAAKVE